ncbi:MAG: carboxypeptidase-like regulatory domain-containing protein [Bryobacteraceae bacterium]|nr:carboxypeptidase-like regulatory domain-containing protein [Bryobacteraceae bacterium]MDW8377722.1 carboxypeptidase-like regulatory domain-containing protein [Bryobacterales bacterium]
MFRPLLATFWLGLLAVAWLQAQTTFGIIRGRVTDPTGAAVPKVQVVVTNTATGISRAVTTGEDGAYEAGYLAPGPYSVTVEAPGFRRFVADQLTLNANAIVLVDCPLTVGDVSASVTVQAGPPLISTESATLRCLQILLLRFDVGVGAQLQPCERTGRWSDRGARDGADQLARRLASGGRDSHCQHHKFSDDQPD